MNPDSPVALTGVAALRDELQRAAVAVGAPPGCEVRIERPAELEHGDLASNVALVLAGSLRRAPRDIAESIASELDRERAGVVSVEVAGPGFLNFRLDDRQVWDGIVGALEAGDAWGRSPAETPRRVNVEFVSANPTGPLHVAHGRGAAIGDAVASLLEWTGHQVVREFYVNDAGRQIDLLGESVEARFQEARGGVAGPPEGGYQGAYVAEVAAQIAAGRGEGQLIAMEAGERVELFARDAADILRREQQEDLVAFGVRMDGFVNESSLFESGLVASLLDRLDHDEHAYRSDGALWLRTTDFGDEKDRVLVKSDGSHTYFVTDIAYHLDKQRRGFELAIDVWGADHHGHVQRMQGALEAVGAGREFLEVLIIQLVKVLKGGEEVRMSKRAGTFVTLRDLFVETGTDVARYFFLMRRAEVPMNFDLSLALDTSEANPVYKVQYAHARMCSIFQRAGVNPADLDLRAIDLSALSLQSEREVAKAILRLPERISAAANARAPHVVCTYLEELASVVNAWYHEGNVEADRRVLADGPARDARLMLAAAVRLTLQQGLAVLGLSAPERMLREGESDG
ncbi:MAG: arginine--tRNA ligase [Gemmatimonadota bacterium]|nr:arginine--tRNA ligase [Gemmatimonadota bacterium]MDH3428117.1 arginine--tRNA ligase [Gemmatimonadota bacterium]